MLNVVMSMGMGMGMGMVMPILPDLLAVDGKVLHSIDADHAATLAVLGEDVSFGIDHSVVFLALGVDVGRVEAGSARQDGVVFTSADIVVEGVVAEATVHSDVVVALAAIG